MTTTIDIKGAIELRQREIRRLHRLKGKVQLLIDEAKAAEDGTSKMTEREWRKLRREVEESLFELGMAEVKSYYGLSAFKCGIPEHWSMAEVI